MKTLMLIAALLIALPVSGQQIMMHAAYSDDGLIHVKNPADYMSSAYAVIGGTQTTVVCSGTLPPLSEIACPVSGNPWVSIYGAPEIYGWMQVGGRYFFSEEWVTYGYHSVSKDFGFAVLNFSQNPQTVYFWLIDMRFQTVKIVPVVIPQFGYLSMFAQEMFPEFDWENADYILDIYSQLDNPQPLGILMADCSNTPCSQVFYYSANNPAYVP